MLSYTKSRKAGKTFLQALLFFLLVTQLFFSQTNIPGGSVSGTWTLTNSPYNILGEITIPNGETLIIEPGVNVLFKGHYKFNVQGRLLAVGTQQDSIRFAAENREVGWHSIRFNNTPNTNDTSKFFYCSFKYGNAYTGSGLDRCGGAMMISYFDKVVVSNCLFDSNKQSGEGWNPAESAGGIYAYYASPRITNSTFSNNIGSKASAIGCNFSPNSILSNNIFYNNVGKYGAIAFAYNSGGELSSNLIYNNFGTEAAGGILVDNGSMPFITNNIIVHNQGFSGGITCYKSGKPVLIGNTIAENTGTYGGGGIGCRDDGEPLLINNILYGNTAPIGNQVGLDDDSSDPIFLNCNIQGGKEGFGGAGAGIYYTGLYANNIDVDPLFLNAASNNYGLSDSSLCIGVGIDSIQVAGIWYKAPSFCFNGNPRPSPIGTMPDIGACESLLGSPVVSVEDKAFLIRGYLLKQNYPNPFNPSTKISWQSPVGSHQTIKVYDVLGNEVATLIDEYKPAGRYEVEFSTSALPSGVYFYRLQSGSFIDAKKMILLK